MELLDRYLHAIEFWLPKRQKQDIIAELSEDLRSQIEEQETELGRKLNDDEVEAILKRCGSPVEVASRYLPQNYLIGPTLFPVYRFVLVVAVMGCVIPKAPDLARLSDRRSRASRLSAPGKPVDDHFLLCILHDAGFCDR